MTRALALPTHHIPVDGWLVAPLRSAGAVLGTGEPGTLAALRLFRSRPTTIGVFADPAVARLLVVRALGAGAVTHLVTPHQARWSALRDHLSGAGTLLTVLPTDAAVPPGTSLPMPALVVDEVDAGTPAPRRQLGPWQTALTVQPHLSPQLLATLRDYDGLVLRRIPESAAEHVRTATGISARDARWLPRMPDDVVALVAAGAVTFATLTALPGS